MSVSTNGPAHESVIVRRYSAGEEERLWQLYRDTTHIVNGRDYTREQCERWAPATVDMAKWKERIRARNPFVAEENGRILGFAELEPDGHIDCFYCDHNHLRKGIGSKLYRAIEEEARRLKIPCLDAAVSVTAKSFFLQMGFEVVREQHNVVCGTTAPNFLMRKIMVAEATC
jgi:GNAT superfamily N-acetyltransferase